MTDANDLKGVPLDLAGMVDYAPGAVVSRTILDKKSGTLTVFAFDEGQGLSEHTAPYDATVMILDGEATLQIAGKPVKVKTGELAIMPADIPHDVRAEQRFKMLLIMIR